MDIGSRTAEREEGREEESDKWKRNGGREGREGRGEEGRKETDR